MISSALLLSIPAALAAEVTEIAPALRGDLELRYDFAAETGTLLEADTEVGSRRIADHTLTWRGTFTYYKGLAAFFELPHTLSETVRYTDTYGMIYDPLTDSGTMLEAGRIADPEDRKGSGLEGTWIGLRGTPFHEEVFSSRGDRSSWMVELGYRFKDKSNFWTWGENNKLGGGPGAPAFRMRTAWSTTYDWAEPYLVADLTRSGRITTDVVDENGVTVARGMEVRPASTTTLRAGTELMAGSWGSQGAQASIDLHATVTHRSWQDIPSGTYLPSALSASEGVAATESESTTVTTGMGVNWRIMEFVQLNVGGDVGLMSPRTAEHFYNVHTNLGDLAWGVNTTLRFRARDPLFDGLKAQAAAREAASPAGMP
jgi:hypothetical protein